MTRERLSSNASPPAGATPHMCVSARASMVDEHTRESLLDVVERSITGERLVDELEKVFATAGGPPMVLRMDNGPELVSQALQQFCTNKVGLVDIPPGTWNNGYIESFNNRLRRECLNRNHWTNLLEARVVIGDFKHEHNQRHRRHSALGYLTPAQYAARCRHTRHPVACEIN
jgi:putative transposase